MSRIYSLVFLLTATFLSPGPLTGTQQLERVPRIGYLAPRSAVPDEFIQGLRDFGYIAVYALRHAPIMTGLKQIAALAIKHRIPAMFSDRQFVEFGGPASLRDKFWRSIPASSHLRG